jgi:hypothetical protein
LLGWRWVSLAAGLLGLAAASVFTADVSLATSGDGVAAVWSKIPAHELISGSIDGFGAAIALGLDSIGLDGVSSWLAQLGPTLLGALIPILGAFLIYSRGVGSWRSADAAERQAIREERFGPSGRAWARSEAVLLVGGQVGLVLASTGPLVGVLAAWIVGVALVAFVIRQS